MRWTVIAAVVTALLSIFGISLVAAQSSLVLRGTVQGTGTVMATNGGLLAVADGATVRLVDISQPDEAMVIGDREFPDNVLGLVMGRDVVYVANSHEGFHLLDVSSPAVPVVRGASPTRGQAVGVAVSGSYAFVADNSLGFDVVRAIGDVTRVGEYLADGFPRAIGAFDDLVFVADQPSGLIIVDVSVPTAPEPVGRLSLGADMITRVIVPQHLVGEVSPSIVCVVSGLAGLQVVDVSAPNAPVVTASIQTAGQPRGIVLSGDEVFVISDGTLEIFDLTEPSRPTRVVSQDVGAEAGAIAVNGELIFVSFDEEIVIFGRS